MSQTTYSAQAPVAFAGLEADIRESTKVHAINQESAAIPFGIALARGLTRDKVKLPAAATDEIRGVAVASSWADNQALTGTNGIAAAGSFNLLEQGAIWVKVEEAVVPGDKAFVRITSDGASNTQLGGFRKSVDSGRARRLKNARYETAADAGGFALLVLDGPVDGRDDVVVVMDHAQNADGGDVVVNAFKAPADRFFVIDEADYVNPTGLAVHEDNYGVLSVKHGTTVAASWSTKTTGGNGALVANTTVAMALAAAASRIVPPGTQVFLSVADNGTTTIPAGRVAIKGHYI